MNCEEVPIRKDRPEHDSADYAQQEPRFEFSKAKDDTFQGPIGEDDASNQVTRCSGSEIYSGFLTFHILRLALWFQFSFESQVN
jgi:hypothetical protein